MKIAYKLERLNKGIEDYYTDKKISDFIKKALERKHKSQYIEQDLGLMPIDIQDFIYKTLEL